MKTEIQEKLEALASKRTIPFCSSDYIECPTGRCPKCYSDDLMTLHPGHGLDWGLESAIREIIDEELTPVATDEVFEEYMREIYDGNTTIGFITYDTISAMKELDPTCWAIAQSEHFDQLESDDEIMSFDNGSTYYWMHDLESLE